MATHRAVVEAQSFHRRRLVTAFVTGAARGQRVEPATPGRSLLAGAALAGLLMISARIPGAVTSSAPDDQPTPGPTQPREVGADSFDARERR